MTRVLLLAFDTASPAVTVAVCSAEDGHATVRAESTSVDARRHGELLAPSIAEVVRDAGATMAELSHIAVGVGPGPYTGLRVGLATAHALRDALGIRCVGVPTLDALAKASGRVEPFVAATDARRKEVFWARYTDADTRVGDISVDRPADVDVEGLPVIGAGAALYPETLGSGHDSWEPLYPTAAALGTVAVDRITAGEPLPGPHPLYLRRPDAQEPGATKKVRQWQQR